MTIFKKIIFSFIFVALAVVVFAQEAKNALLIANGDYARDMGSLKEPIPEARRKAVSGCTRCIVCQEYFEHGWP